MVAPKHNVSAEQTTQYEWFSAKDNSDRLTISPLPDASAAIDFLASVSSTAYLSKSGLATSVLLTQGLSTKDSLPATSMYTAIDGPHSQAGMCIKEIVSRILSHIGR